MGKVLWWVGWEGDEVGALYIQSFHDSKVIKTIFNHRSTLFLRFSQKTDYFLYEFLREVGQNNFTNTICLHGDTYITPLYCIGHSSRYNMWHVETGSHTRADVHILCFWTHIQYNSGVIYSHNQAAHMKLKMHLGSTVHRFGYQQHTCNTMHI